LRYKRASSKAGLFYDRDSARVFFGYNTYREYDLRSKIKFL